MDQSDAGSTNIVSRWTNQTQVLTDALTAAARCVSSTLPSWSMAAARRTRSGGSRPPIPPPSSIPPGGNAS
eukprot:3332098-Pyramimonas_sp.AAC.1